MTHEYSLFLSYSFDSAENLRLIRKLESEIERIVNVDCLTYYFGWFESSSCDTWIDGSTLLEPNETQRDDQLKALGLAREKHPGGVLELDDPNQTVRLQVATQTARLLRSVLELASSAILVGGIVRFTVQQQLRILFQLLKVLTQFKADFCRIPAVRRIRAWCPYKACCHSYGEDVDGSEGRILRNQCVLRLPFSSHEVKPWQKSHQPFQIRNGLNRSLHYASSA